MQTFDDTLSNPNTPNVATRSLAACMEACAACEIACQGCADACLAETDLVALRRCIRLNLDCADLCVVTARSLARSAGGDAKLLRAVVEACARACAMCAAECELHAEGHDHCRLCAESCRYCAEACGAVLRELPDTYGETHPKSDEHPKSEGMA